MGPLLLDIDKILLDQCSKLRVQSGYLHKVDPSIVDKFLDRPLYSGWGKIRMNGSNFKLFFLLYPWRLPNFAPKSTPFWLQYITSKVQGIKDQLSTIRQYDTSTLQYPPILNRSLHRDRNIIISPFMSKKGYFSTKYPYPLQ